MLSWERGENSIVKCENAYLRTGRIFIREWGECSFCIGENIHFRMRRVHNLKNGENAEYRAEKLMDS